MTRFLTSVPILYLGPVNTFWHYLLDRLASRIKWVSVIPVESPGDTHVAEFDEGSFHPLLLVHETFYEQTQSNLAPSLRKSPILYLEEDGQRKSLASEKEEVWIDRKLPYLELENLILRQWMENQVQRHDRWRKQADSELDVIARTAHDLKGPLASILAFCHFALKDNPQDNAHWPTYFKRIEYNAHLIEELITRYLTLFKESNGKIEISPKLCDVRSYFSDNLEHDRLRMDKKGIHFTCEFSDTVPSYLEIDSALLMQVVRNLLDNAIKFTDRGRIKLFVDYQVNEEVLMVEVIDTGRGIHPEEWEFIFDPYTQSQHRRRPFQSRGSIGLGLSNARKVARMLGGDVKLVDSTQNEGSVFVVQVRASEPKPNLHERTEITLSMF